MCQRSLVHFYIYSTKNGQDFFDIQKVQIFFKKNIPNLFEEGYAKRIFYERKIIMVQVSTGWPFIESIIYDTSSLLKMDESSWTCCRKKCFVHYYVSKKYSYPFYPWCTFRSHLSSMFRKRVQIYGPISKGTNLNIKYINFSERKTVNFLIFFSIFIKQICFIKLYVCYYFSLLFLNSLIHKFLSAFCILSLWLSAYHLIYKYYGIIKIVTQNMMRMCGMNSV